MTCAKCSHDVKRVTCHIPEVDGKVCTSCRLNWRRENEPGFQEAEKQTRHNRYLQNRETILDKQREYNCTHRGQIRQRNAARYAAAPEKYRAKNLRVKYDLTLERYAALLEEQSGCCAICLTKVPGGNGHFHVDHDHQTGKVRGLLCNHCNLMLGHALDDEGHLAAAIEYLREQR